MQSKPRMKFQRFPKAKRRGITPRRLAAAKRFFRREQEKLPLFAAQIAAGQPTPEARINAHEEAFQRYWQHLRDTHAGAWRRGRAALRSLPIAEREYLIEKWNNSRYPKDSAYFADMVHCWIRDRKRSVMFQYWFFWQYEACNPLADEAMAALPRLREEDAAYWKTLREFVQRRLYGRP